jgi:ABC-type sulfate transport system permease component
MDAEEKATEASRFRYILVASVVAAAAAVLAVVVGIIAAWPVVRDWFR